MQPLPEIPALEPVGRDQVMDQRRRFVHAAASRMEQPEEELVVFAGSERAVEFPEVGAQPADTSDRRGADRHVGADRHRR